MPGFMTPDQLAARTARALDAAVAAGRALGLAVTDAAVLHDVFSVVVHLAPSPVVVRVPAVLPSSAGPDAQAAQQQTELDLVSRLAEQGVPVVPPSPLVPAGAGAARRFLDDVSAVRRGGPECRARLRAQLRAGGRPARRAAHVPG
ncbi:hypothetical protein [Streptomyces sp. MP131-18]|uniref:hypothetical protein n=1 Tax=Streptomyces sp. MP131-18 TaxID=1857892 RepID=UPI001180FF68|nr:hypothetical protein [Streptomyces sp. MP131-18]